ANASSNSVIVTDTAANIRRLVEIISAMDTHLADASEVKVYQLKYASAANAAKLINDIFKDEEQVSNRPQGGFFGGRFPFGGGGGPGGGGGGPGGGGPGGGGSQNQSAARRRGKVSASSDERTNTIVVTGPPDILEVVTRVVKEIDSNPVDEESVFIYSLKNA